GRIRSTPRTPRPPAIMRRMAVALASFSLAGDKVPADAVTRRFEAREAVSEPYTIDVDFVTRDPGFRVDDCLRTRMSVVVTSATGLSHYFDGIVERARFVRIVDDERIFAVRLRPALAALEQRAGCRIFQEKSVVQVVQTLFDEAGFGDKVQWQTKK